MSAKNKITIVEISPVGRCRDAADQVYAVRTTGADVLVSPDPVDPSCWHVGDLNIIDRLPLDEKQSDYEMTIYAKNPGEAALAYADMIAAYA